jgi:hypothetical protein
MATREAVERKQDVPAQSYQAPSLPVMAKTRYAVEERGIDHASWEADANEIVDRMMTEYPVRKGQVVSKLHNAYLLPHIQPPHRPGSMSANPIGDFTSALEILFPGTTVINTTRTEADRLYGTMALTLRSLRVKIDLSRIEPLKPESVFHPAIRTHNLPHIKENTKTVLATMAKRNADTPNVTDPISYAELWTRGWEASKRVYYVSRMEEILKALGPIEMDERSIREWVMKQTPAKRAVILGQEDFSMEAMLQGANNMMLMLKAKLKPNMDPDYASAVKLPQSVQYDGTGKSVLLLSPLLREKVKREQMLLKPNVLIMQQKSPQDLINFLNGFDWRPNEKGERWYVEIDQSMFDKSQITNNEQMYLDTLRRFGMREDMVEFIHSYADRSASSIKAGVKINLRDQNPSGAPFTLDRNNETTKIAIAELLESIEASLEFVMIMEDDVTIAVRGQPDVRKWEREMARKYNLNPKINVHRHGYFCSFDVVHLPDGSTTIVRDVLKALLSLLEANVKSRENLYERYQSFVDSMGYVDDADSQHYLVRARAERWVKSHGEDPRVVDAFTQIVRGMATWKNSFEEFSKSISDEVETLFY